MQRNASKRKRKLPSRFSDSIIDIPQSSAQGDDQAPTSRRQSAPNKRQNRGLDQQEQDSSADELAMDHDSDKQFQDQTMSCLQSDPSLTAAPIGPIDPRLEIDPPQMQQNAGSTLSHFAADLSTVMRHWDEPEPIVDPMPLISLQNHFGQFSRGLHPPNKPPKPRVRKPFGDLTNDEFWYDPLNYLSKAWSHRTLEVRTMCADPTNPIWRADPAPGEAIPAWASDLNAQMFLSLSDCAIPDFLDIGEEPFPPYKPYPGVVPKINIRQLNKRLAIAITLKVEEDAQRLFPAASYEWLKVVDLLKLSKLDSEYIRASLRFRPDQPSPAGELTPEPDDSEFDLARKFLFERGIDWEEVFRYICFLEREDHPPPSHAIVQTPPSQSDMVADEAHAHISGKDKQAIPFRPGVPQPAEELTTSPQDPRLRLKAAAAAARSTTTQSVYARDFPKAFRCSKGAYTKDKVGNVYRLGVLTGPVTWLRGEETHYGIPNVAGVSRDAAALNADRRDCQT